jgi:anhydro-N-acetylmuramic acid kinase
MPAVIAERTGVTTAADLSCRDIAAGGAGAPLMTLPAYLLFRHPGHTRLVVHLGGMARVVLLPAACRPGDAVAFEAGPCGVLLDAMVRHLTGGKESCDAGGKHAVQGRCIEALVESWQAHPQLGRRRGLSRQAFGAEFARSAVEQLRQSGGGLHDLLCSATHFVVRAIVAAVRRHLPGPPDEVLLTGWGVRNGLLWRLLEGHADGIPVARSDEAGVPAELHQAAGAAVLAALTVDGVPGSSPAATGAAGSRLLGSITPGTLTNWGRCVQWMGQHAAPGE